MQDNFGKVLSFLVLNSNIRCALRSPVCIAWFGKRGLTLLSGRTTPTRDKKVVGITILFAENPKFRMSYRK